MWHGRREAQEVAAKIDGNPGAGTHVLEGVPAGSVDARREGTSVEKRSRRLASERRVGRVEPQHNGVVEQFDRDETDRQIER